MIWWSTLLDRWVFSTKVYPDWQQVTIPCESYREAFFFKKYEADMDQEFMSDYFANV